jgi:hypothetical protein
MPDVRCLTGSEAMNFGCKVAQAASLDRMSSSFWGRGAAEQGLSTAFAKAKAMEY